jgi:hypothetical protein
MAAMEQLCVQNGSNVGLLEPRKLLKRQEIFLALYVQPEPVLRDSGDFNDGSAVSNE